MIDRDQAQGASRKRERDREADSPNGCHDVREKPDDKGLDQEAHRHRFYRHDAWGQEPPFGLLNNHQDPAPAE